MSWIPKYDKLQAFDRALNSGLFLATTAALVAVYVIAFRPLEAQFLAVKQEAEELGSLVERTHEISRQHRSLDERVTACRKQTSEIWQRIPSSPRESDYLAQVCQLAERTGVHVADYHPGAIEERENHHELEVRIAARGEYKSLCRFLEQVDQIPRLSRMTHMEITAPPEGHLTVELTYRIYFAPPANTSAAKKG